MFCAHLQLPLVRPYVRAGRMSSAELPSISWEKLLNSPLCAILAPQAYTRTPTHGNGGTIWTRQAGVDLMPQLLHLSSVVPRLLVPRCLQNPVFGARRSKPQEASTSATRAPPSTKQSGPGLVVERGPPVRLDSPE